MMLHNCALLELLDSKFQDEELEGQLPPMDLRVVRKSMLLQDALEM
ncbi:hypothetical protein H6A16_04465 [Collinsella tanakaei]|nr:hypothetical protein [Collinsella tanakaei]MBM6778749.1 hypothetical protein [Collinsella tanakaei]